MPGSLVLAIPAGSRHGSRSAYKRRSRRNRAPPGPRVQLNEFLDKQAIAQRALDASISAGRRNPCAFRDQRRRKRSPVCGQAIIGDRWFLSGCYRKAVVRGGPAARREQVPPGQRAQRPTETPQGPGGTRRSTRTWYRARRRVRMAGGTILPHDNGRYRGGRPAAVNYYWTGTCKPYGIDPVAYLQDILRRLPPLSQTRSTNCHLMPGSPRTLRRGARRPPEVSRDRGLADGTMGRDHQAGAEARPAYHRPRLRSRAGWAEPGPGNRPWSRAVQAAGTYFSPAPVTGACRRAITSA